MSIVSLKSVQLVYIQKSLRFILSDYFKLRSFTVLTSVFFHCRLEYERLEEKHQISETERLKQELIYKHELESRMIKIESQKDELEKLEEQFKNLEEVMELEIAQVKAKIYEEKRGKIEQLDSEVQRLLLLQKESGIVRKAREEERLALQMIWKKETGKLSEEKDILNSLENDLSLLDKDIEEVRRTFV